MRGDDDEIVGLFSPQRRLFRKSKAAVLFRAKVSYRLMYILHESAMTPTHSSLGILNYAQTSADSKNNLQRRNTPGKLETDAEVVGDESSTKQTEMIIERDRDSLLSTPRATIQKTDTWRWCERLFIVCCMRAHAHELTCGSACANDQSQRRANGVVQPFPSSGSVIYRSDAQGA